MVRICQLEIKVLHSHNSNSHRISSHHLVVATNNLVARNNSNSHSNNSSSLRGLQHHRILIAMHLLINNSIHITQIIRLNNNHSIHHKAVTVRMVHQLKVMDLHLIMHRTHTMGMVCHRHQFLMLEHLNILM